jgi:HEPN domain-containing protein
MSNFPSYRITTSFDEALFWMDQSLAFFESSKVLENSSSEYKAMPIVTLQSFSIECSLKALLLLSIDKYPEKHDSIILFGRLPDALRINLSNQFFSDYALNLSDCFDAIKGDFIGSRYHFEDFKESYVGRTFFTGYLETVSDFLIKYIKANGDAIYRNRGGVTRNPSVTLEGSLEP